MLHRHSKVSRRTIKLTKISAVADLCARLRPFVCSQIHHFLVNFQSPECSPPVSLNRCEWCNSAASVSISIWSVYKKGFFENSRISKLRLLMTRWNTEDRWAIQASCGNSNDMVCQCKQYRTKWIALHAELSLSGNQLLMTIAGSCSIVPGHHPPLSPHP